MNRSYSGATEADARSAAAADLGIPVDDVDVRELVRRLVNEVEEVEIVVRVEGASSEIDDSELLAGFGARKPAAPEASPAVAPAPPAARKADPPAKPAAAAPRSSDSDAAPAPRPERASRGPRRPEPTAEESEGASPASPQALAPRARDYLAGIIQRMDIQATFKIEVDDDNVYIEIVADEGLGGLLIGRKGQTLDALQYLTNRVVLPGAQARGRVYLDTENYREKHRLKLEKRALELRDEAVRDARSITLEELSPRDRWIIHQALMEDDQVTTKSVGESDDRRLMIIPR